jgi:hypothetical protein
MLDPDEGTMIVTMWGITVIDTALYPIVTMMTTVPAAAAAQEQQQHVVLMFLKDTKNRFSIILFIKKQLSQDDRNKNGDIIDEQSACSVLTFNQYNE